MKLFRAFTLISLLFTGHVVQADVLVLVHGWASDASTWIRSGVQAGLVQKGWRDGGAIINTPGGVRTQLSQPVSADRVILRAQLPAEAPMLVQASHLLAQLQFIKNIYPKQKLIVAGHSAGGIVARIVLVNPRAPRIDTLISIASPNLGTARALDALDVTDGKPFFCPGPGIDFVKTVVGGSRYQYLKDSRAVLVDLMPAGYSRLLGWLNAQKHPDIEYHAIIKQEAGYGEAVVPAFSQDLNRVASLKGRARVHLVRSRHALNPADASLIADILE